jgi:O-methyltransferase
MLPDRLHSVLRPWWRRFLRLKLRARGWMRFIIRAVVPPSLLLRLHYFRRYQDYVWLPRQAVQEGTRMNDVHQLYLDLMKRTLCNTIYADENVAPFQPPGFDLSVRSEGADWPKCAHTMIGLKRLDNLQYCIEDALARHVAGDLVETGVWRGGAAIFMRAVLKAYSITDRRVWAADSFQGLPRPDVERYPQDAGDLHHSYGFLAVSLEEVQENFRRYGLLDDQIRFLKGWFRDTLPAAPIERIAVLRLDGDMYESTWEALTSLYPKLSVGGYAIIDDYKVVRGCRQAVDEYRGRQGIADEIIDIDFGGVFWRRSA